jgi:hypothetical protein
MACAGGNETLSTVDAGGGNWVGYSIDLALGADGLPVISYGDETVYSLKVAKCNDAACAGGNETLSTVDDTINIRPRFTSIALGVDGFPVISYVDVIADALRVAKCNDAACQWADEEISAFGDSAGHVGSSTSLAIGSDGLPVIAYYNTYSGHLRIARCNDPACAGGDDLSTNVDSSSTSVGLNGDLAISGDGFPVIAYLDYGLADFLKVAKCHTRSCMAP